MLIFGEKITRLFSYNTIFGFPRLVLLISVSVFILSFYLFVLQEVDTTRGYILKNFEQTINIQRSMIANWFLEYAGRIKTFSELKSTREGDMEVIKKNIEVFARNNTDFSWFAFVDINGRTNDGYNVSEREYFKQCLLGKAYISNVLYGRVANMPFISFSYPVFDQSGNVIGGVVGTVKLTTISKIMEQFQFGVTGDLNHKMEEIKRFVFCTKIVLSSMFIRLLPRV